MQFVYDFDGVLFDTKKAVRQSWIKAGVTPPRDFWKVDWRTWCNDPELYERRDAIFKAECLGMVKPLPMLAIAMQTGGMIMTNGSARRVVSILEHYKVGNLPVKCGLTVLEKVHELNAFKEPGIFVEDQWENATLIRKLTKWHVILLTNQS